MFCPGQNVLAYLSPEYEKGMTENVTLDDQIGSIIKSGNSFACPYFAGYLALIMSHIKQFKKIDQFKGLNSEWVARLFKKYCIGLDQWAINPEEIGQFGDLALFTPSIFKDSLLSNIPYKGKYFQYMLPLLEYDPSIYQTKQKINDHGQLDPIQIQNQPVQHQPIQNQFKGHSKPTQFQGQLKPIRVQGRSKPIQYQPSHNFQPYTDYSYTQPYFSHNSVHNFQPSDYSFHDSFHGFQPYSDYSFHDYKLYSTSWSNSNVNWTR